VRHPPCLGPHDDLVDRERRDLEISERGVQPDQSTALSPRWESRRPAR
jgi:hypothetical protein